MKTAQFSPAEAAREGKGVWLPSPPKEPLLGISTDTRADGRGTIFFALKGEKFDAHDFLDKAVAAGCAALCIQKEKRSLAPAGLPLLLVDDPLQSMHSLAAFHRRRFPSLKVAGVTGSVGKTSVKEMLRAIFTEASDADAVLYTIGNTNNSFGVPQNLFRLTDAHRFAVIEMGTSSPGEIAPLSRMAAPDVAIVNSIAACHLEKLRDFAGVAKEKATIWQGMTPGGCAVFPLEAPAVAVLENAAASFRQMRFGADGKGEVSAFFEEGNLFGSRFSLRFPDGKRLSVSWNLTGRHQCLNAAAAASAALALEISAETIAAGLSRTELPGMRMKHITLNGITYVNDAYNANPASMKASAELLADTTAPEKLLLVLGGMRELGENSAAAHRELLETVNRLLPGARILTIGPEFAGLNPCHAENSSLAAAMLPRLLRPGDTVFAKGSRGNRVELALPEEAR